MFLLSHDERKKITLCHRMAAGSIDDWGPPLWQFLHVASFAYPESPSTERQQAMLDFLQAVGRVLPCSKCRMHYGKHCKTCLLPEVVRSRSALTHWLVDLHNEVNLLTGKRAWTYDDALVKYAHPARRMSGSVVAWIGIVLAVVCVAIALAYGKQRNTRLRKST